MHGWKRNPKAPSSLWDGLVLDGAYAGLHPGTNRFVDGSGLENHGVLTNMDAASDWVWSNELQQQSLDFDGGNDYVDFGVIFDSLDAFTLSAWINQRNTLDGAIISKYSAIPAEFELAVSLATSRYFVRVFVSPGTVFANSRTATSPAATIADQWVHVCGTYTGGLLGTLTCWQNGTPGTPVSLDANRVTTRSDPVNIGRRPYAGAEIPFPGKIASSLCHSRALAPEEITWLADRSNRMYTPDTRRAIWVPTPFNPALMRRRRRMAGAR